ncbi:hypothetical protein DPMN_047666 [Dreissena polymorpha]|uniref:Uncharacterized protein n=1 Tax=Dreissena polymorpha TaxID=45954 RepID=A0A9D4I1L9_DREPO|nr:hypothetical protein DPMN_047666 [Dreissena polymorpha]
MNPPPWAASLIEDIKNIKQQTLIKDVLRIEKNIELDRVHRIGKETPGKTRPIVAKFHHYSDRELVRKASIEKNTDLRALHQGVGIQQTKGTLEKRRNKQHIVDRERNAGRTTKWAGSRLLRLPTRGYPYGSVHKAFPMEIIQGFPQDINDPSPGRLNFEIRRDSYSATFANIRKSVVIRRRLDKLDRHSFYEINAK